MDVCDYAQKQRFCENVFDIDNLEYQLNIVVYLLAFSLIYNFGFLYFCTSFSPCFVQSPALSCFSI